MEQAISDFIADFGISGGVVNMAPKWTDFPWKGLGYEPMKKPCTVSYIGNWFSGTTGVLELEWNIKYCHITKVTKNCIDLSLIYWSTAPCPPSSLTAAASCGTNRVTISWLNGTGAHSYTASVVGNNGPTVSCTSNTTSCSVKVECGHTYIATVVSTVGLCNSTTNNSIQFKSGIKLQLLFKQTFVQTWQNW